MSKLAKNGSAKKIQDAATRQIFAALKAAFPNLPDDPRQVVYRYNPVAIRSHRQPEVHR